MSISEKKLKGQYFTVQNPFKGELFHAWRELLPPELVVLEPFAGAGNLFDFIDAEWHGFDINPQSPSITKQDTLKDFPQGFDVCITNPPYLARTVVSRKGLDIDLKHVDLYLDCLDKCLENCGFVAAIIPSTYINQGLFKDRLFAWDKLDYEVFQDTDAPVGVAYFVPAYDSTPLLGVNGQLLIFDGNQTPFPTKSNIVFNPDNPTHTLVAIDSLDGDNIHIAPYNGETIKGTNRHIVPLSGLDVDCDLVNDLITKWRRETSDFYLTSFMSCQRSGKYRKRILFNQIHWLVNLIKTQQLHKLNNTPVYK